MVKNYFPIEEYEMRWARVYDEMRSRGHTHALVLGKGAGSYERCLDVLYLSNYYSTTSGHEPDSALWNARSYCGLILALDEEPELIVDDVNWQRKCVVVERVSGHFDVIGAIAQSLNRRRLQTPVALVGTDFFPVKYMRQLERLSPQIDFREDDDLIRNVRRIKSACELDCFREAGELTAAGLNCLMEDLVAGKTQREAAARAGSAIICRGGAWRRMIINHGDTLDYLERDTVRGYSNDAPLRGDMVRAWVDGIFQGYWLDPGRSAVCGAKPDSQQREVLEAVIDVCEKLRERIRPGVRVMDIALLGDELVEASGFGDPAQAAWPYYGHGLGAMWEAPLMDKHCCTQDEVFEAGMVLGVECFLKGATTGVAGYEDNFIVTAEGTEVITPSPPCWW